MSQRFPARLSCVAALLAMGWAAVADGRGFGGHPGGGNGHGRPAVVVEPSIDLSRPRRPDRNAPDVIMANIEACASDGVRLFVACLRGRASPVAIRRLEACLRSETIPDDLGEVAACLPRPGLR